MAKNYIGTGEVLAHVCLAAQVTGVPFLLGDRLAVPLASGGIGATISVKVNGVFNLPKVKANAPAQGDILYWDASAKKLTTAAAAGANKAAGYAAVVGSASDDYIDCAINA